MLKNITDEKAGIDAMHGHKKVVTDHSTVRVLLYMEFETDMINYKNKLQKVIQTKK